MNSAMSLFSGMDRVWTNFKKLWTFNDSNSSEDVI